MNLIGNGLLALLEHPDQLERWRNDPALDTSAVDELLRFNGPVQNTVRVPLEPVTYTGLDGEPIIVDPGSIVTTCLGAANRIPHCSTTRCSSPRSTQRTTAPRIGIWNSLLPWRLTRPDGSDRRSHPPHSALHRIELVGTPTWRDRYTIRGVDHLEVEVS